MYILRQVAEGVGGRVCLEKRFPRLIIMPVAFPVSKRSCKWGVRWAQEKDVLACMFNSRSAMLAIRWRVRMKSATVFASWCMVREDAGHTACGLNVIRRQVKEKGFILLVDEVGLEQSAFSPDREPTVAFVRLGPGLKAPMYIHIPFEPVDKVRPQYPDWDVRT